MPSPPNQPYRDPVLECEIDLDFSPDFEDGEKAEVRKSQGIISCAGLASVITSAEIMWLIEYYNLSGRWLRPRSQMRMHYFPDTRLPTPRMVLTNKLAELIFGWPMHPFFLKIVNYYNISPVQLSPNSYRLEIGLHIISQQRVSITYHDGDFALYCLRRSDNDLGFFVPHLLP